MAYRERELACPHCGGKLVGYPAREKWRCAGCGGVLCGPDEVPPELAGASESRPARGKQSAPLGCPACATEMERIALAGVQFERCARDGLTWFDSGELGYLRAYFAEPP